MQLYIPCNKIEPLKCVLEQYVKQNKHIKKGICPSIKKLQKLDAVQDVLKSIS